MVSSKLQQHTAITAYVYKMSRSSRAQAKITTGLSLPNANIPALNSARCKKNDAAPTSSKTNHKLLQDAATRATMELPPQPPARSSSSAGVLPASGRIVGAQKGRC